MITLFCIRPKGFNVGNDAIFLGLQHFLYEAFEQVVNLISIPATSRYESQAKAGLTPKTIYEINQYGHGVIVGGGNLYENGELEVNLDSLETLEVPLMLFSLSRGGIYNRQHKLVNRTDAMPDRIILALHKKARYSLARDNATGNYLKTIGCHQAQVGGCPTLFLDRMAERLPKLPPGDKAPVLVSIRNPSLMNIPLLKQSQIYNDVNEILNFLKEKGFRHIRLLCHDHRDIPFAASFTGTEYVYTGDVYSYLSLLRSCELNISYRLHSVIPCLAFGTPAIKISYDQRAMSLLETIGLKDWNIDMINSKKVINEVADRFNRLKDLTAFRPQIKKRGAHLYSVTEEAFKKFASEVLEYRDRAIPS